MSRTARRADGAGEARRQGRAVADIQRRLGLDQEQVRTVRNVIPWRTVEKELAARLAAKEAAARAPSAAESGLAFEGLAHADTVLAPPVTPSSGVAASDVEAPPSSGVRSSRDKFDGPLDVLAPTGPMDAGSHRPLTYSMYTIADLESANALRGPEVVAAPAPQVVAWADVGTSATVLLRALGAWVTAKPRPRVLDVCRVPLAALGADLRAVLARLPWRRMAIALGVAVASVLLLLFAVVTVAELTDDLKPSHGASRMSAHLPAAADAVTTSASLPAPEPALAPVMELDTPAPAPASVPAAKPKAAPRAAAKAKARKSAAAERFIP